MFSYNTHGQHLSPFLLLDYAGPYTFAPSDTPRGVGQHPHRGFETVTIVYEGEVAHRDSTGAGGTIGPGDVQWMTAASGILHEEFHTPEFSRRGGTLDMVQLWVNLPARTRWAHRATRPCSTQTFPRWICLMAPAACVSSPAASTAMPARPAPTRRWMSGTSACSRATTPNCRWPMAARWRWWC
jgi:redox-sensitive bicupin YhaK (pirin superfamily)